MAPAARPVARCHCGSSVVDSTGTHTPQAHGNGAAGPAGWGTTVNSPPNESPAGWQAAPVPELT